MRKPKFEDPTPIAEYFCDPAYPDRTIRETAKHFDISKSACHLYLTKRLFDQDPQGYYNLVQRKLKANKEDRSDRGGEATRRRWENVRKNKE